MSGRTKPLVLIFLVLCILVMPVLTACKGDGSELLAVPNYARANRLEETGDDADGRSREFTSKVWIKENRE